MMAVSGRVLDADGQPLAGARVAVCARQGMVLSSGQWWASFANEVLGQVKTDQEGRYRLSVPRTDPQMTFRSVRVVATAADHGLAWKALNPDAEQAEAEVRLTPVQRVSGHIVGLQGEDAAGVTIHVARITRKPEKGEREEDAAFRPPEGLPLSATTDDKGNFVFHGFGPNVTLELEVRDHRYERKEDWKVNTADRKQCENLRVLLAPGRCVEGRVVFQDTGKPVPHARLRVFNPILEAKADADGRFRIPLFTPREGEEEKPFTFFPREVTVSAFPPRGSPYLGSSQGVDFPKGVVKREIEFSLPRGELLLGRVTEAGSGKPVAGAYVAYNGDSENAVVSGPDGSFRVGVPVGSGRLVVTHPSGEFIPVTVGSAGGSLDKPVGEPTYHHAILDVDVKKDDRREEVAVTLRRGVTVKGRLVGPDDKPVAGALMFVGSYRPRYENTMHPILVRDGRFELTGLDPERTYRALFLEHPNAPRAMMTLEGLGSAGQLWTPELLNVQNRLGASVEVSPKKDGAEALVVRMAPCGSAKLRFVNGEGKPLAGYRPWLQLAVTPGLDLHKAVEQKALAAEVINLAYAFHEGAPQTDAEGRITFTGLIPGATYRLKQVAVPSNTMKEFTVEAEKTLELEVVVK
jgi:protocatechuate 3,4-dioxygenase beta subunit